MQNKQQESPVTNHKSLDRITLIFAVFCLALTSGYFSGRILSQSSLPITLVPDTRSPVPTVHIDGIRNGVLHGRIIGSARVVIGDTLFTQSGVFAADPGSLLVNTVTVTVPSGAQFVASKRGKKYYPVFSAEGERIAPNNRIYFKTDTEAEGAGYRQ